MAVYTELFEGSLPTSVSGTVDFTSSGKGTPSAVIAMVGLSTASTSSANDLDISMGVYDGTTQSCRYIRETDGSGTSECDQALSPHILTLGRYGLGTADIDASWITDGVRLTSVNSALADAYYVKILVIWGVDAAVNVANSQSSTDNTTTISGLSFQPKAVLLLTSEDSGTNTSGVDSCWSIGAVIDDGSLTQRCVSYGGEDGQGTTNNTIQFYENRIGSAIWNGSEDFSLECTAINSDGYGITTRDSDSGSASFIGLALGGADLDVNLETITTPTSLATQSKTITRYPWGLVSVLCTADSTALINGANAEGVSLGLGSAGDGLADADIGFASEHNAGTSDTYSKSSTQLNRLFDGANNQLVIDNFENFSNGGFDIDFTTVDATARKGFWLSLEGAAPATSLKQGLHKIETGEATGLHNIGTGI